MVSEDLAKIVAENLVDLRKGSHMTQQELAEKFDYSGKSVSKWENGYAIPSVEVLKQLADFYGVNVDYLLSKNDPKRRKKLRRDTRQMQNRIVITAMLFTFVWLIAVVVYCSMLSQHADQAWISFIWGIPVSFLATAFMSYRFWGRGWLVFSLSTLFLWTTILAFYLSFLDQNVWYMFLAGIPLEVILVLFTQYK